MNQEEPLADLVARLTVYDANRRVIEDEAGQTVPRYLSGSALQRLLAAAQWCEQNVHKIGPVPGNLPESRAAGYTVLYEKREDEP